jgi:hypothetical protein
MTINTTTSKTPAAQPSGWDRVQHERGMPVLSVAPPSASELAAKCMKRGLLPS